SILIYLIVYMLVAFILPTYRVWKRTGINPVTFGRTESAHDYVGMMFRLVMLILSLVIAFGAFFPSIEEYLIPIFWLDSVVFRYAGYVMLAVSLAWIVAAQLQMADSWRIGIDQEKTQLVTTGVFGISRNPIFLGMLFTLSGILLAMPNAFTLLVFALGYALIQIQVRLEEDHLVRTHGDDYQAYAHIVRRWL
ncbi:MAG TPA: isoprenylcysteine carboxylmethyltransferase family protein, partial [Pyrinomonadaceae bacterium]|nr:isoprenylcysteine carboxylmethyltransferase family protein [Pyrinomonadaceae bacterium]